MGNGHGLQLVEFKPIIKSAIYKDTIKQIQARWSPRLAVLLMSDLQLSRSQFEALRHYLSFEYDVTDDVHKKLHLYVNPFNEREKVDYPALPPRCQWEPERDHVFGLCGVKSSDDGMVSYVQDQRGQLSQMVSEHWPAISSSVKENRQAMLVAGFGDATGGWRGSSITHFELGICSWEAEDIEQGSKCNLLPAALGEGDDGVENLRLRFQHTTDGFDDLASGKPLDVTLPSGKRQVPIEFTFCGDMQIHKAILGMSKFTSAIWCECEHDTTGMFRFRPTPAATWAEVEAWYLEIGCKVKTIEKVCELNHYSYDVLMGRAVGGARRALLGRLLRPSARLPTLRQRHERLPREARGRDVQRRLSVRARPQDPAPEDAVGVPPHPRFDRAAADDRDGRSTAARVRPVGGRRRQHEGHHPSSRRA